MPPVVTIALAKSLLGLSRGLGRGGGSALPGLVAERIDPAIGAKLAAQLPHGSIIVTGTNGKTTTAKMLARMLTDSGEVLVQNRAGSNLSRGIVSALVEHASVGGAVQGTIGLFEVDEAAMPAVCRMVQPKAIIVLNLFRDQLDRYGELDTTAQLIGKGIGLTDAKVYLNVDDPLVASLAQFARPNNVQFFGVEEAAVTKLAHDVTADSANCPVCGRALHYTQAYFGHIGRYRCPEGHFNRPRPTVGARSVTLLEAGSSFKLSDSPEVIFHSGLPGLYNVYNALAATALMIDRGSQPAHLAHSLEQVKAAFGRVEQIRFKGRTIYLLLVKNPTGFNQIIQTFLLQEKQQYVLFAINDNFADGRDVSWLWDVAFEELVPWRHRISTSGIRATDMALRLKYANLSTEAVTPNLGKALSHFITQVPPGGTGYVVPTYTAMLALRKSLGKATHLHGVWE